MKTLTWVAARFSINGGKDECHNYQVMVTDGVVDNAQLIDKIAQPYTKLDIRVIPTAIVPGDICGNYPYNIDTVFLDLKEVTVL